MSSNCKLKRHGTGPVHTQQTRTFYPAPYIAEQTFTDTPLPTPSNDIIKNMQPGAVGYKPKVDHVVSGRELGIFERLYYRQGLKGADVISLMMKLESTYLITEVAVRHAINNLMERHPLMRMSVTKERGSYYMYERTDDGYDFLTSPRKDWMRFIKEEFDTPFDMNGKLLWRIRMLNSSRIKHAAQSRHGSELASSAQTTSSDSLPSTYCARQSGVFIQTISDSDIHIFREDIDSNSVYKFTTTFLFIFNHAISDGGYTMWLFQEFVNFLDAYMMGVNIGQVKQLPLLPPFENCLALNRPSVDNSTELFELGDSVISDYYLQFCHGQGNPAMLNRYKVKFAKEIQSLLAVSQKNNFIVFQFNKTITRRLVNACRSHDVKVNTIVVTASLLALIDLLYDPYNNQSDFEIPFEYMSDSRRGGHLEYEGSDQFLYTGLASMNIPLMAIIPSAQRPFSTTAFWTMSKSFNQALQNEIQTRETIERYHDEGRKSMAQGKYLETKGKSPFILCFSNMGKLDELFNEDVSKRIRLVDLHGQSSILTDDMPVFFVNTFSLDGRLFGSVSYCEGFTSETTAMAYLALLQKYLTSHSNL